ncbi:MAG: PP0621 family protein [Betaproteobacteria bacterium]|nr:PP0621 family protein [Betaproteobacteria bacterium]MDH4323012.1 PP0621 family protein [Betaproteobacteria bacterium]MDH5210635.1 PP0621 family protein [Betaproteobacteria bacterium]MDH5577253.1 PP0621 family protein [Betaproteobacteria bacterium]
MGRLILLALAVLVLVWLLRRALRARQGGAPKVPGAPGELVACAHCGVHLPRAEARSAPGGDYCSEAHARLGPREP